MLVLYYIITVLAIIVGIAGLLVALWVFLSVNRKKKGLSDFKYFRFYSEDSVVKTSVSVPFNKELKSHKPVSKNIKRKERIVKNLDLSTDIFYKSSIDSSQLVVPLI